MKKNLKIAKEKTAKLNNKGITLIALVVTIVVLLILAGITIDVAFSDEGIFSKVERAQKEPNEAAIKEKVQVMLADAQLEKLVNNKTLKAYFEEQGYTVTENTTKGTLKITIDEYYVTIKEESLEITNINKRIAGIPIPWDGTEDTSWYNETDTEFIITTAEQLAGLSALVDGGNTFENKTIKLGGNIDLRCENVSTGEGEYLSFDPIGSYKKDLIFKGTFDGQGYTILNLYQEYEALNNSYYYDDYGLGLFAAIENATIKNVRIYNAEILGYYSLVGFVAGVASEECLFENIQISNSFNGDYDYYAGGIVGWAGGNQIYRNITIDSSTTISAIWGSYKNKTGGVIGGISATATTVLFENCNIACKIDAYNDICSNYPFRNYRYSGMLIGDTKNSETINYVNHATAPQLTAINCTVTYGDWAKYTYCEFESAGAGSYHGPGEWRFVRVQPGPTYPAYSGVADANGNLVVDNTHAHDEDEDHNVMLPFDQLFGGDQGICGNPSHEGVTVIYNYQRDGQ